MSPNVELVGPSGTLDGEPIVGPERPLHPRQNGTATAIEMDTLNPPPPPAYTPSPRHEEDVAPPGYHASSLSPLLAGGVEQPPSDIDAVEGVEQPPSDIDAGEALHQDVGATGQVDRLQRSRYTPVCVLIILVLVTSAIAGLTFPFVFPYKGNKEGQLDGI